MGNPLNSIRRNGCWWLATLATLGVLLAPWWRNRSLLRDFFDYGLMMVSTGRMANGQMPYVDFITPLPTLSYLLNFAADRWFGQDYLALTWGNAVLITLGFGGLTLLLRRWFGGVFALLFSAVLVAGSVVQHTVIWYNALGVLLLAPIAWGGAVAPVWRRENAWLNGLAAAALVLSGMNKLNFHAIAVAVALAWTLRAGLQRKASWTRVLATMSGWLVMATVVPLTIELWWTGATWEQWRYNIFDVAFRDRGGNFFFIFSPASYLLTVNDYYHALVKPLGAILAGWLAVVAIMAWRGRDLVDRVTLIGAVTLCLFGTQALMVTNYEIGYVAMAAGMVLLGGIWLGFGLPRRGRGFTLVFVLPMMVSGGFFWHSAWLGQRALFGHSAEPRDAYREVRSDTGEFQYIAGLRIPPEIATDLEAAADLRRAEADQALPYFYGAGAEWLERIWPTEAVSGLPILMASLGYGPPEVSRLKKALSYPPKFEGVLGAASWEFFPGDLNSFIKDRAVTRRLPTLVFWTLKRSELMRGLPPFDDAVGAINSFGGNLDGRLVEVDPNLSPMVTPDDRPMLGLGDGTGSFRFKERTYDMLAEVSLERLDGVPLDEPLAANFAVQVLDNAAFEVVREAWRETFTLPAGETSRLFAIKFNTFGQPTRFDVTIAEAASGKVLAGWLLPRINSTAVATQSPPNLRQPAPPDLGEVDRAWREAIFPSDWVDDVELVVRNARLTERGVSIDRGGEIWFRGKRRIAEWWGRFLAEESNADWNQPVPRVIWYNGGRLEVLFQQGVPLDDSGVEFRTWNPELDGWFGVLVDKNEWKPGAVFRVQRISAREP